MDMSDMEMGEMDMSKDSVVQSHRGYELEVTSNTNDVQPNKSTKINYKVKNDLGEVLKDFATVHEKIMHFIVVREDLQQFQHIHPDYNQSTGEFSVNVTFPTDGPYRIFPDFTPGKNADNPQLLPVTLSKDLIIGDLSKYVSELVEPDTSNKKTVSGYEITYTVPSNLQAQSTATYTLSIARNGQDVTNLQPYLGAMGHSVILKAETLDFIHAHAESASATGPDISFSTSFPGAGIYKTFTQFQHQEKVITSDFVISVAAGASQEMMEDMEGMGH
jgi:hypothetical protein